MLGASEDRDHKEMGEAIVFMSEFNKLCHEYSDELADEYVLFETLAEVGHNYSEVGSFGSCTPDRHHHCE